MSLKKPQGRAVNGRGWGQCWGGGMILLYSRVPWKWQVAVDGPTGCGPRMAWKHQDYPVCPRGSWELADPEADPKLLCCDPYKGWLSSDQQVSISHLSSWISAEWCQLRWDALPPLTFIHGHDISLKFRGHHKERSGTLKGLKLSFYCLEERGVIISINFLYRKMNLLCPQLGLWSEICMYYL